MADDWYRVPDWTPEAQESFEARLRRARRFNRNQYLRIKALSLSESGQVEAARSLWLRVLEDHSDDNFGRALTLEHLGDSFAKEDPEAAEGYYRCLLAEYPTLNGTSYTVENSLAQLLVDKGDPVSLDEALSLLNAWAERDTLKFPNQLFKWHLALSRIAQATGDEETAQEAARTALELADAGPMFPRHKGVGVVRTDDLTLMRLRKLAK